MPSVCLSVCLPARRLHPLPPPPLPSPSLLSSHVSFRGLLYPGGGGCILLEEEEEEEDGCGRTLWTDGEPRGFSRNFCGRGGEGEAREGRFISMGHVKTLPRKEARVSRLPERVDNRGSSRRRLTLTPFLDHRCSALGQRVCTGCVKSFQLRRVYGTFGKIGGASENTKCVPRLNLNEANMI